MKMKRYKDFIKESNDDSINESIISTALSYLLAPISLPIFLNSNSKFKLKLVKESIDKYLNDKAEYEVIDEARYDIEIPSLLKTVTKRRNELSKKLKKYPTLQSYKENFCKWFKKWNLINLRNNKDIDWICDEIMKIGPINEELEVKKLKSEMEFDMETGKATVRRKVSQFQRRLNDMLNGENNYNYYN